MELYTLGIWVAKSGRENEFVKEWESFARWSAAHMEGAGKAVLLRDEKDGRRFISFGPWKSREAVSKWRESGEFKTFASKVKDLCDDFQPGTYTVAASTD